MARRPASPRIFRGFFLLVALLIFSAAGVQAAPGREGDQVASKPGPILEGKIQEKMAPPAAAPSSLILDPFFLIQEEASRVQVLRVQVALELVQPEMRQNFDPQAPGLREVVYDFLASKEQADPGRDRKQQDKVLAGLVNRYLGQEAVSAVKVDQSFLLLR
jgi:hypothetical protein